MQRPQPGLLTELGSRFVAIPFLLPFLEIPLFAVTARKNLSQLDIHSASDLYRKAFTAHP